MQAGHATIRKSNTDQLQGAYLGTLHMLPPSLPSGVNNWEERTPLTLLEQEQDIVCIGLLEVMNLAQQNGMIGEIVNGTIHH